MISSELINKIRKIEVKTNKLVDQIFLGDYRSGFSGKGMEFDSIREYMPGDDVRGIDWNVTARTNRAFVKQFIEEREMNMFLLIDMSRSTNFGRKKEFIAELSATLAFAAIRNNDRVGALFFTGKMEKMIPSQAGKSHVLSIIENILIFQPRQNDTNIAAVLRFFNRIEKKRCIVFLISDFLDEGYEKELKAAACRHDLIQIRVVDSAEERIPAGAIFTFKDLETEEVHVLDNMKRDLWITTTMKQSKINLVTLHTDEDYVKPLKIFFKRKGRQ